MRSGEKLRYEEGTKAFACQIKFRILMRESCTHLTFPCDILLPGPSYNTSYV